ncbi:Na+/H+ antiporter subunit E [Pseudanabaena sp. FACHB-2040]|uniref:Na+/H+ antiporter subunit E n=1 Tax=Pseudanabaena sp. FACHB-2040 TaxID=2692859 RepID=UPI0016825456|nr:Na+/H+ antiporter subunit E [Pseudanabaena sp. FACHB-2040]MBD2259425.1 Na+/H+ antiporter subunit E [Pseudanabaena sp. FACHB-2040]
MVEYLNLILRLAIWFLLTANLSVVNILIGVSIAFLLPHRHQALGTLKEWLRVLGHIVMAIPLAYYEAFEMILRPHQQEDVTLERVRSRRTSGLIFLDIFLITFTPKTIVLKYHEAGWYEVHRVSQRRQR